MGLHSTERAFEIFNLQWRQLGCPGWHSPRVDGAMMTAIGFDVGLFLLVTGALVTLVHHLSHLATDAPG